MAGLSEGNWPRSNGERLSQRGRVAGGRGSSLELATHMKQKPACRGVSADARIIIEAVLVRTAVVVDDGRAEMIAVAQRRAADAARHGVDRLHPHFILRDRTRVLSIVAQLARQCLVNPLRLVRGGACIIVFDAAAHLVEHVVYARARPRAHAQVDRIHKAQGVKTQHGRIDPTVPCRHRPGLARPKL